MKSKTTILLASCAVVLSGLLAGCGNTPVPTANDLNTQAHQLLATCIRSQTSQCTQMLNTFCDGMEAFIKSKGSSISMENEFGGNWPIVSQEAQSCPNLSIGVG